MKNMKITFRICYGILMWKVFVFDTDQFESLESETKEVFLPDIVQ